MKFDEEVCRRAVEELLSDHDLKPSWMPGTEPPDWFLDFGGKRWAVEATSIHGFTDVGGRLLAWSGFSKELLSFGRSVCEEVASNTNVPGKYMVDFPPIPNLSKWRSEIVARLSVFLANEAAAMTTQDVTVLFEVHGRELSIWKVSDSGSALFEAALPSGQFISRLDDQLRGLLHNAIQTKIEKLKPVIPPILLVILDRYGFQRSLTEWRDRLPPESHFFKSIIRVQQDRAEVLSGTLACS